MTQSFGSRMRQQRENRGIDLIAIAAQTKIKRSLLEALERDDVSQWPSGIFRRAFIRAYAHAIGLEPDSVVREFLDLFPEPTDAVAEAVAALAGTDDAFRKHAGPPIRLRYMMGSALSSLSRLRRGPAVETRTLPTIGPLHVDPLSHSARPVSQLLEEASSTMPENEGVAECGPRDSPSAREPGDATLDSTPFRIDVEQEPDLLAVADLVTEIGCVDSRADVQTLLREMARVLEAAGIIVWVWDDMLAQLRPAFVHGYSAKVLAQLPTVTRDADNVTAAAFRSARTCEVTGAIVVPLLTTTGCCGVLAIELPDGTASTRSTRAITTILAAAFAQLIYRARPEEAQPPIERFLPAVATSSRPSRPVKLRRP